MPDVVEAAPVFGREATEASWLEMQPTDFSSQPVEILPERPPSREAIHDHAQVDQAHLDHAQLPKVINTFGKKTPSCLSNASGSLPSDAQLDAVAGHASSHIIEAVRRIEEMQGILGQQVDRMHGELRTQIDALTVRQADSPSGTPANRFGMQSPYARASQLAHAKSGQLAHAKSEADVVKTKSGKLAMVEQSDSPLISAASGLKRQSTFEYTQAALKRANLQSQNRPTNMSNQIDWTAAPRSVSEVKKRFHRSAAARLLRWSGFDTAIGIVILMNSIVIGWEINTSTQGNVSDGVRTTLATLEIIFLVIYTWELGLRFYVEGIRALTNSWVVFDSVLVSSGVCAVVIRNLAEFTADEGLQEAMKQVILLRVIRILRLVRALRLVRQFKTMWRLVNGLLTSLDTVLSALTLVALVLYVASCIGVELITGNEALNADPALAAIIETEFSSVPSTMMTLMQFVTMDDLSEIYKPIIRAQPLTSLYFVSILMIVSIALLNLITAVLVEGALESARKDHEMEAIQLRRQVKNFLPLARELFRKMDTDGSGVLTLAEIQERVEEDEDHELHMKLQKIVPFESVVELFESLDIDGDGEIPEQEFVDGVLKAVLAGHDNAELAQILRLVRIQGRKMERLETLLGLPKTNSMESFGNLYDLAADEIADEQLQGPDESWKLQRPDER